MLISDSKTTSRSATWLVPPAVKPASLPRSNVGAPFITISQRVLSLIYASLFLAFVSMSVPSFASFPTTTKNAAIGTNSLIPNMPSAFHGAGYISTTAILNSISPASASRGTSVNVTFSGSGLAGATAVRGWGPNVTVSNFSASDTAVTATFTLNNYARLGTHYLSLATPSGRTNSVPFQVLAASGTGTAPVVTSVTPAAATQGQTVNVTFSGSNLASTTGVSGWGTNATVTNLSATATAVTATFAISSQAAAQTYALSLVSSSGTSNPVSFQVAAASGGPTLSVNPTTIDFGNDPIGTAAMQSLTLSSTGSSAVTVNSGSISGTGFTMSGAAFPVTLNPGVTVTLQVQFDPSAAGASTGSASFSSNSSTGGTTAVALTGTGTHWVSLNWAAPPNSPAPVTAYNVFRAPSGSSSYQLLNSSPVAQTTYADDAVFSGSTYSYYVESVSPSGTASVPSSQVTVTIP